MHAYLGQEHAGEGSAAGEVRVAHPDMLVARETPTGQPVAARDRSNRENVIIGLGASASYASLLDPTVQSIDYPCPGRKVEVMQTT